MDFLIRAALLCTAVTLILPESATASVVFQPGKKAKFVAPGEEQVSETALELYNTAQSAEKGGNLKRAIRAYADIVRRHPKDALAPSALGRNYRNKRMPISTRRIRTGCWSKSIPAARTSMKQSRRSFASVKCIWPAKRRKFWAWSRMGTRWIGR